MTRAVILLCFIVSSLVTLAQTPQWTSSTNTPAFNSSNLPVVCVESAVVTEGENNGCYMVLLLSLSKRSKDPVKVQYQTLSNTELEGEDYLQKKGILTFPANRLLQTLKIQVDCNVHSKLDKTFFVKLSGVVNATPEHDTVIGTINSVLPITGISRNQPF
ncbi:hypothetical protein OCK74_18030 [Chitinophagaceae bacterium LB-8]|uniref:Calx-beta domain-containing protein n=1 Tax=Paraflavisolibacter caeni TaxID=2982496 RepID=A0A9X2XPD2_9BACT|nr:Calx-beta domain-containing protein [Paraflavisolibacter caeni]MCU7551023.1 hypothetical protein [Paraflavisolibacter caeni]